MELKKEKDQLVAEKAQLWDNIVPLEAIVFYACQHVFESTVELDVVVKEERLGAVI